MALAKASGPSLTMMFLHPFWHGTDVSTTLVESALSVMVGISASVLSPGSPIWPLIDDPLTEMSPR